MSNVQTAKSIFNLMKCNVPNYLVGNIIAVLSHTDDGNELETCVSVDWNL